MVKRKLGPVLLATAVAVAAGCTKHNARAAAPVGPPGAAAAPQAGGVPSQAPAPFATPPVLPGTPDVATLVARVTPAVVNITTVHDVRAPQQEFDFPFGFDPFGAFPEFGPRRRGGGGDQVFHQKALGSGFIVDAAGHVVTNNHVVEEADSVRVKLSDDREFDAKVKGRDPRLDLAVLELVGAHDLPTVSLGSSEALRVGEYVVAIGNPFGLGNTVTMGIVSAKSRSIGAGLYDDFIQTDASINPGNSGGPLFNLRGQVVGINTAINPNGRGIGFAIPVDALKDVLPQLLTTGRVARGRIGVGIQSVDAPLAKALGMDRPRGALVGEVKPGSPAERAGLRPGDVITKVDQTDVVRSEELPRVVARHAPGSKIRLEVLRDRATRTVEVTLDEVQEETAEQRGRAPANPGSKTMHNDLGVQLQDAPGGKVLVTGVAPGGAADGQLEPGDVILEVNRSPVNRAGDVAKLVTAAPAGRPILFKIMRNDASRFVAVERH
jgi:serine protease Do